MLVDAINAIDSTAFLDATSNRGLQILLRNPADVALAIIIHIIVKEENTSRSTHIK